MTFLQQLLFESVLYWGIFSFILFAVVLLTRARSVGAYRRYALPGVIALIALLFVLQKTVTTQRERILESLDTLIAGVADEDERAIAGVISRDYSAEDYTHDEIVAAIMRALENLDIYDVRYRRRDVTIDGESADLILGVMASVRAGGQPASFHTGRWRIGWTREAGSWRIVSIRPEMIDTIPLERLRSLLRHYRGSL
jgi:hypothetical protein